MLSGQYRAAWLAGLALAATALTPPASAQVQATADYDLPAQSLDQTLHAIAQTSGREILFRPDAVQGRAAPPVRGRLTLDQALREALAGTPLIVEYRAGAALVREPSPPPAEQPAATEPNAAITVTGTRIRGAGSASPVTVTTRQDLEQAGISDLADFTRVLPQNYTGGQNRGIAGGGEQNGQQNLDNSATLNLRGLGPDATLTLLDGHRLSYDATNQGIDISAIPLEAIDRIEVVADGSSALYGSDAVGGVANIILRRDFKGVEATARIGGATGGGDFQQEYSLVGGNRWSSGGFMAALDASKATPVYAGQRDYTRTVDPSLTLTDGNRQLSGVISGHQQIASGLELIVDGYAMDRRSLLQNPFSPTTDVHISGLVSRPHVRSYALTPTLQADLGRWRASLSATDSNSRTLLDTNNYANGVPRHQHLLYQDDLKGLEATGEGPLFALPGGDARLAVGGGLRRISLHDRYQLLTGGQSLTTEDFSESRNVQFAYGELSLPLAGPAVNLPLLYRLTLSAALRYEHWTRIASVTTPKLGIIYQPIADITFRATWGKSFKIPTLLQAHEPEEADLVPGFYFTPPPQPAGSPVLLLAGSAPNLKPERATTWSGSAELTPRSIPDLNLRATWFHIDYRDRIAEPLTNLLTALYNPLYDDLIIYNPTAAQVNAAIASVPGGLSNQTGAPFDPSGVGVLIDEAIRNTERQQISGVDLDGDYHIDLGPNGRLLLTGAASYLASNQQLAPNQPTFQLAGTVFNPPHWHGRAGAVWEGRRVGFSAYVNYVGATSDSRFPPDVTIAPFVTLDVSASLRTGAEAGMFRNLEFRLTALNILNEEPHFVRSAYPEGAPYDSTNESAVGRFIGVSMRKAW